MIRACPRAGTPFVETSFMETKYRIVSDASHQWRRKEADRMKFLALPPEEAQRLITLGIDRTRKDFPADPDGFVGLTDEEDGLVE